MDLTQGKVWKKLILFILPIIFTMLLQQVYVLTDSVIVSNCIEETALAIISPSSQVLSVFQCVTLGVGVAVAIIVANLAGTKDFKAVKSASKTFIVISLIVGGALTLLSMALGYPMFLLLNVPEDIFKEAFSLYFIYVWSVLTGIMSNTLTTILTSLGDSKRPFIVSTISGVANVLLDLFFIKVCGWGIASCAYATLAAQLLLVIISALMVRKELNKLDNEKEKMSMSYVKEMVKLGIPSVIQQAVMSIGSMAITSLIYSFGTEIIAGNVAAEQINMLLFIPGVAITNGFATFASQNYGARNQKRIEEGFRAMHMLGLIVNTVICVIAVFGARYFIYLFTNSFDSESYTYAYYYLMFCLPYYYFLVFKYGFDSLFKAKKQIQLFIYSSFANLGLRIAFAYLFTYTLGIHFVNISMPASTLLSGILDVFFWKYSRKYKAASELINQPLQNEN